MRAQPIEHLTWSTTRPPTPPSDPRSSLQLRLATSIFRMAKLFDDRGIQRVRHISAVVAADWILATVCYYHPAVTRRAAHDSPVDPPRPARTQWSYRPDRAAARRASGAAARGSVRRPRRDDHHCGVATW